MGAVRTVLVFVLVGAVLGAVAASFIVPPVLSWYNEPGAVAPGRQVETICNLPEMIRYTSSRLLRGQLIGAALGALLFLYPGIADSRLADVRAPSGRASAEECLQCQEMPSKKALTRSVTLCQWSRVVGTSPHPPNLSRDVERPGS